MYEFLYRAKYYLSFFFKKRRKNDRLEQPIPTCQLISKREELGSSRTRGEAKENVTRIKNPTRDDLTQQHPILQRTSH